MQKNIHGLPYWNSYIAAFLLFQSMKKRSPDEQYREFKEWLDAMASGTFKPDNPQALLSETDRTALLGRRETWQWLVQSIRDRCDQHYTQVADRDRGKDFGQLHLDLMTYVWRDAAAFRTFFYQTLPNLTPQ